MHVQLYFTPALCVQYGGRKSLHRAYSQKCYHTKPVTGVMDLKINLWTLFLQPLYVSRRRSGWFEILWPIKLKLMRYMCTRKSNVRMKASEEIEKVSWTMITVCRRVAAYMPCRYRHTPSSGVNPTQMKWNRKRRGTRFQWNVKMRNFKTLRNILRKWISRN